MVGGSLSSDLRSVNVVIKLVDATKVDNINDLLKLLVARIAIFQPSNIGVGDTAFTGG